MSNLLQVVRGGLVVDPETQTMSARDILIRGDTILELGTPGFSVSTDAKKVPADGKLLIPGLVNAHTHGHGSLGKGLGDRWTLELYLSALPWVGGKCTLEDRKTAAELNAAEMILKGCTAAYDMCFDFPTVSRDSLTARGEAYTNVGVRTVLAPMMADKTLYQAIPGLLDAIPGALRADGVLEAATSASQHLAACREVLENWAFDEEWVKPGLGPTIPLFCSDDFLAGCRDLARDHAVAVQIHLAESKVQAVAGLQRYGVSLTGHLNRLGFLGPHVTAAHCVWVDDDDIAMLADAGAKVAHNPGSNLRLGSGIAPARRILAAGIPVGIGTDGSASSDNQNMFEAMRAAAFVSRAACSDPQDWLSAWEVFGAATQVGARVLGFDRIGRLAPGYKADIVMLNLANVNYVPFNSGINQIVFCEDSSAVHSVMVGGRMVLQDHRFVDFDYDALRGRVARTVERLRGESTETKIRCDAIAEFVGVHCGSLNCSHYPVHRRLEDFEAQRH